MMLISLRSSAHTADLMLGRLEELSQKSSPQGLRWGFTQIEEEVRKLGKEPINLTDRKRQAFETALMALCDELERDYPVLEAKALERKKADCELCLEELAPLLDPAKLQKWREQASDAEDTAVFHRGVAAIHCLAVPSAPMQHQEIEAATKNINSLFRSIGIDLVSPRDKVEITLTERRQEAWKEAHIQSGLMLLEATEIAIGNGYVEGKHNRHRLVAECKALFDWPVMRLDESGSGRITGQPLTMRQRLKLAAEDCVVGDMLFLAGHTPKNGFSMLAALPAKTRKGASLRLV